jgi:hypothetical protein
MRCGIAERARFQLIQVEGEPNPRSGSDQNAVRLVRNFLGVSTDDAGGAELGWLLAAVLQNVANNLVKGGMNRVTLALTEHLQAHGGEIRTNVRRPHGGTRNRFKDEAVRVRCFGLGAYQ